MITKGEQQNVSKFSDHRDNVVDATPFSALDVVALHKNVVVTVSFTTVVVILMVVVDPGKITKHVVVVCGSRNI